MDTKFNVNDLIQEGLVKKKAYTEGKYKGLSVLKYDRKVFFNNLWNKDKRLLDCRGIVVDENNNIISYPFTKVFNLFENGTKVERDKEVVAVRKMNGFLAVVSLYKDEMLVSTTGTLDSDFAVLARQFIKAEYPSWKPTHGFTYMFEICHSSDPHIIKEQYGIYLIGIRQNYIGSNLHEELWLDEVALEYGMKRPEWGVTRFSDLTYNSNIHCKHEGFMIRDPNTDEILCKLKSKFYLQKKALQRVGRTKVDKLFDNTDDFAKGMDEEFYSLIKFIKVNYTKESYLLLTEQQRSEIIFKYFEHKGDVF